MAKENKEERARREGMSYALRIAKERGIDGLEEELKYRGATQLPIGVNRSACDEVIENIKGNTIDTIMIMACMVLRDEFGFGTKRLAQFIDRFNTKTDCLCDDYCTWQDLIDTIEAECGITLRIRANDKDVKA